MTILGGEETVSRDTYLIGSLYIEDTENVIGSQEGSLKPNSQVRVSIYESRVGW